MTFREDREDRLDLQDGIFPPHEMSEQTESKQKNHTKHASVAPELEGTLNVYTAQEIKMHGESKSILQ